MAEATVERIDGLIVARVRGEPTADNLRRCQERILGLVGEAGGNVLYDALTMEPPPVDVPLVQRALDEQLGAIRLRRAVIVPNSKLAYLARLAFGEGEYRVFYNDVMGALQWLGRERPPAA
jgi:hypothetical protein